jgi:hypothetical protein
LGDLHFNAFTYFETCIEKNAGGDEEDEEEKKDEIEFLGKAPKNKDTRITFYDPPLPKPTKKFDDEEKSANELLRQF